MQLFLSFRACCGLLTAEQISMVFLGLPATIDLSLDMRPQRARKREFGSHTRALLHCGDTYVSQGRSMNAARIVAIVLIAGGVLGLVYHGFSYTKESQAAKLGSLELTVQHKETFDVPNWLGVGAIVAGAALLLFGGRKP
jgi:drug/metabolite transporter (DMT)-like permease